MAGNMITTAAARRLGNVRLLYLSYVILSLGILIAALSGSLTGIFIAQILLGLGAGISGPLCMGMSIQKVEEAERATAMGLHQAVYAIGMFAGPWLSGILTKAFGGDQTGIQPMFAITAAACFLLSMILTRILSRREFA